MGFRSIPGSYTGAPGGFWVLKDFRALQGCCKKNLMGFQERSGSLQKVSETLQRILGGFGGVPGSLISIYLLFSSTDILCPNDGLS